MKHFLSIGAWLVALLLAVTACTSPASNGSSGSSTNEVEPAAVVEQEQPAAAESDDAEMAEEAMSEEMVEEKAEEMTEADTGPSAAEIAQMERAAAGTIRDNERAGNRAVDEAEVAEEEVRSLASFLPDLGDAPEVSNGEPWINSDPLTLEDLEGKVVLIEFWTYS